MAMSSGSSWVLTGSTLLFLALWGIIFMVDMSDTAMEIPVLFHAGAVMTVGIIVALEIRRRGG